MGKKNAIYVLPPCFGLDQTLHRTATDVEQKFLVPCFH